MDRKEKSAKAQNRALKQLRAKKEKLKIDQVFSGSFLMWSIAFSWPVYEADEVIDGSLGAAAAHLAEEPVIGHQQQRAASLAEVHVQFTCNVSHVVQYGVSQNCGTYVPTCTTYDQNWLCRPVPQLATAVLNALISHEHRYTEKQNNATGFKHIINHTNTS